MNKWTINKNQFLSGISYNPETGMEDMFGVSVYKDIGYAQNNYRNANIADTHKKVQWMLSDTEISNTSSYVWMIAATVSGSGTLYQYKIDDHSISASTSLRAFQGYGGVGKLGNYLYTGDDYNGLNLGKINLSTLANSQTYSSFNNTTQFREMVNFKDRLYMCDGNEIIDVTVNGTVTKATLDIEDNALSVSLAPYNDYLAIGAIYGKYLSTTAVPKGIYHSQLYLWDTYSSSWDADRSTRMDGRILKVLNKKGTIYVVLQDRDDSFTLNYFNGTTIVPIKRITPKPGTSLMSVGNDAFDVKGDQLFMTAGFAGDNTIRVLAYGQGDAETPVALTNPYSITLSGTNTVSKVNSVKWGAPDELYVSYTDAHNVGRVDSFRSANLYGAYNIKTPVLSTGQQQILNKFRVDFQPLQTGQTFSIYHKIDNASSWTLWDTTSYAQLNENKNNYVKTNALDFNTIQFQLLGNTNSSPTKFRSIQINSVDNDRI